MTLRVRLRTHLKSWFSALRNDRGLSSHTLASYKNAWRLLIRFGADQAGLGASTDWLLTQVHRELVLGYLSYVEKDRGCSVSTRNVRLAAVQSFFKWVRSMQPDLAVHCDRILGIPCKRTHRPVIDYLERDELRMVLETVDLRRPEGIRDLTILALAYNTAARVHELANLRRDALWLTMPSPTVKLSGKGRKERKLPLWSKTAELLRTYLASHRRPPADEVARPYVFLNHRGYRMTRWGIARVIERGVSDARTRCPSLSAKHLTAHSIRHTTAVHLLQSGVDLVTIQNWLGHSSPDTVHVYLALDLQSRRDLLERCLNLDEVLASDSPDDDWLSDL
jgi:integrase/recombinase XerD